MSCSAVTLSVATVLSVIAVACLAIGFSTDNWYEIRVDQNRTKQFLETMDDGSLPVDYESNYLYYSRDEGLFRLYGLFDEEKKDE
ncbi:hypothetical protein QR98_0103080 [Sarcoptes scabiei]|uniref:Uncharacterized protein n=1 Tax=Sarcoptes scabiei TaxID=52283 RepID=A0A132ALD7_SARSC|nr:hypothetical protein QR98_0103080 [Sarcoptes scabiei]